jgi:DNA helicase HerA-like ATPase
MEWNNRIGVFGTAGTGKSWFTKWIVKQYLKLKKRRYNVIFDDNIRNIKEYEKMGFHIQEVDQQTINLNIDYTSFIQYHEKIVFLFNDLLPEETPIILNAVADSLYKLSDSLLVIDEAHYFLQRGKHIPKSVIRYARGGRKQGSDILISTHRTTDIDPDIINLLNCIISFRVNEINTLQRISKFFDQFNNTDHDLIDQELNLKQTNQAEQIIKINDPEQILKKLPNRYFLYSDLKNGIQEISSSNILSI